MCVAYYSVDILNHCVLQCLSSLPLKISKDSDATIFSLSEFQSSMILWLNACFLSSDSKCGLNSFLVRLYIVCVKNFLGSILSNLCKILNAWIMSPLFLLYYIIWEFPDCSQIITGCLVDDFEGEGGGWGSSRFSQKLEEHADLAKT